MSNNMATWSNISFQDSSLIVLIVITMVLGYFMMYMLNNKLLYRYILHSCLIESIWSLLPAMTLIFIALPSIRTLYLIYDTNDALITIKTIGCQWYWSYEYSDLKNIEFDTYMLNENDLENDNFRLLDVDNRTIMPLNIPMRILTTTSDVLHSWTVLSSGIKVDAMMGWLNQASFSINRPGLFYGQCSEMSGVNNSFMPIVVESTSTNLFLSWMKKNN